MRVAGDLRAFERFQFGETLVIGRSARACTEARLLARLRFNGAQQRLQAWMVHSPLVPAAQIIDVHAAKAGRRQSSMRAGHILLRALA